MIVQVSTGHSDVFISSDGTEDWGCLRRTGTPGRCNMNSNTRAQTIAWNASGSPRCPFDPHHTPLPGSLFRQAAK